MSKVNNTSRISRYTHSSISSNEVADMASLYGCKRVPSSAPRRIRTSEVSAASAAEARRLAMGVSPRLKGKSRRHDILSPDYMCTWQDVEVQNDWNMMSKEQENKIEREVEAALYYQQRARERKAREGSSSSYEQRLRELDVLARPVPPNSWAPSSRIPGCLPFTPGHYNPNYPLYCPVPNPLPLPEELPCAGAQKVGPAHTSKGPHKWFTKGLLSFFSSFRRARADSSDAEFKDSQCERVISRRNSMIIIRAGL
ncbi:hypothetical protein SERLA73DRAFT_68940 [Serpula lacrymans var. lacrymans S7.3]|uniref:Uncharacterized protein n=2 Tax=Serpula lacrymans var. lacrymans TaxID=341189 RepID=F8PFM6_SERL3|nr:uncharacterized protein SERLADRAFT_432825 [Serpula lacrymans var. lacrymans S7.9]EGO05315.1 hypothetical protein SERLA73DRAFT_68940 [Serpula lacrymans var. lacrymans S7.3]EGO31169.1 hypothetical protein SERLADRAFT_432825 [Serpula lacrymans var. lacrymans S7.9]